MQEFHEIPETEDDLLLFEIQEKKEKLSDMFRDPVLQARYEAILSNEEELLSLDREIAATKVRFHHALRQENQGHFTSNMLRSLTDAIERAVETREKQQEFIHIEQLLYAMQTLQEIVDDEVRDQNISNRIAKRISQMQLPRRDQIPIEMKATARALAEGRDL